MKLSTSLLIFNKYPALDNFEARIISNATVMGYDVSKRIHNIYFFLIGLVIVFILMYSILKAILIKNSNKNNEQILELVRDISICGVGAIICGFLMGQLDIVINYIMIFLVIILIVVQINEYTKIDINVNAIEWGILLAVPIIIFIQTIFPKRIDTKFLICIIFFISLIFIYICNEKFRGKLSSQQIEVLVAVSTFPIFLSALIQSLLIEILNILNRRGIWIYENIRLVYITVFIAALIIGIGIFFINKNRGKQLEKYVSMKQLLEKRWYLILIMTVGVIIAQPPRQVVPWNEYFETANHGLALDGLFRYGQIPIIENFDAHMLYNQLLGILYYIFNGYEPWAYNLYSSYILIPILSISYIILSKILDKRNALIFMLILPIFTIIFHNFILVAIVLIYLYKLIAEDNKWDPIYFWMSIAITVMISLDIGVAAVFAGVFTYLANQIIKGNNNVRQYIRFFGSGLCIGLAGVITFTILCLSRSISPIKRMTEFLKLALSNQNWAYSHVGDQNTIAFSIAYYIVPIILISIMGYTIYSTILERDRKYINKYAMLSFIFFSVAYLINIPRGVVRHSLAEGRLTHILSYFPIAILCFILIWEESSFKKMYKFTIISIMMSVLVTMNLGSLPINKSLITQLITSVANIEQYMAPQDLSSGRVNGEVLNTQDVKDFKLILDFLLEDGETYLDLTSLNYYYALVEREKPVYVNQSPLMLSGEIAQKLFLEQIKNSKVPIAILPIQGSAWVNIDGVNVLDKYYLLTEYVYQHYEPLCRLDEFSIWVSKKDTVKLRNRLKIMSDKQEIYEYDFSKMTENTFDENNVRVITNEDRITMIAQGEDPYIYGVITSDMPLKESNVDETYDIKLKVRPSNAGYVQVFYRLNTEEHYHEEQSQRFEVKENVTNYLKVRTKSIPVDIRIDIESISEIEISNISIVRSGVRLDIITADDIIETTLERTLGLVPWYWARDNNIREVANLTNDILKIENFEGVILERRDLSKEEEYINLMITSDVEQDVKLILANSKQKAQNSSYIFKVKSGENNYRFRVSTDYGYYVGKYDVLKLQGIQSPILLNRVSIEKE